jgi:guanylate kinase
MDGIYIGNRRPKSKKAVKEAVAAGEDVILEVTRFGHEDTKTVSELPEGKYNFVGPDPYTKRDFYGTITVGHNRAGDRVVKVS